MNRLVFFAVALVCFAGTSAVSSAPGIKPKDKENDLEKLKGNWTVESWVQFGRQVPLKATWTCDGEKYTLEQETNVEEGTFKIDPAAKPPNMDLHITGGNCKGNDQVGLYKIDGDELTLCFAWPGVTDRPVDFTSTAENRMILITLKRKK
jgi:uncharacterized protein (TIGR03067 family)